jgi:FMN-dependent NADH-azoreductase
MSKRLLFIQCSPRLTESKSIQLAESYLNTLCAENPDLEVETIELWKEDLPAFDGDKVAAKMNIILGKENNGVQQTAWDQIVSLTSRFISADRYLFAVPMWNGGIPYRLKQFIDVVHQPGLLFQLTQESGYEGLLQKKHATLMLTAGVYADRFPSPQFGVDYQSTYLRFWLTQAGIIEIDEVRFQPTLLTADAIGDLEQAKQRAIELARRHGRI